jgi:hypothetical protein
MIIRLLLLTMLSVGIFTGQLMIDGDSKKIDTDSIWQEYQHEDGVIIPEPIVKGLMYMFSVVIHMGFEMAEWVNPHGFALAIVVLFFGIIHLHWLLYPFLFIYVLLDERKKEKKEIVKC